MTVLLHSHLDNWGTNIATRNSGGKLSLLFREIKDLQTLQEKTNHVRTEGQERPLLTTERKHNEFVDKLSPDSVLGTPVQLLTDANV